MTTGTDPDPDVRWRRALREPFATVRTVAGELADRGQWPADPTGARVVERLAAAPAAEALLEALRREVPVAVRVGDDLPAGPAAVTPDGGHVAVIAGDRVEVWDRGRSRATWSRELPGSRRGRRVAARSARWVVVGCAGDESVDLMVVEPNDTAAIGTVTGSLVGLGVWEPDRVVSVSDDATVTVWSVAGGPARRMVAPGAAPVEDASVEAAADRVVLRRRGGERRVLDLVTGEVEEVAPAAHGVVLAGGTVRVAVDPAGRLRVESGGGAELGTVVCAVGEGTRLAAVPDEALVVVSDVDARVPTTVWTARGARVRDAVERPLLTLTPEQLAVVDATSLDGLSDAARHCLSLFREVLALRLRDAVEITVEVAGAGGGPSRTGSSSTATHGPGPRDVEIDDPISEEEEQQARASRMPAALGGIRTAGWWGR